MKILKASISLILLFVALNAVSAKTSFNKYLSDSDKVRLNKGEVVIVNTGNTKKICIETDNPTAKKLINTMTTLKPSYFAEIIQVKPYKGNEDLIERIKKELLNVEGYAGIPYWSERHERYYDLYDWAKVLSRADNGTNTKMVADVYMSPFGEFETNISLEQSYDGLLYLFSNKTKMIVEEKFTAAGPEKMKSGIAVFRDGDNWVLYGAGGVDALSLFFLRDRIETSFINRIKSFTAYFIQKVDTK